MLAKNWMYYMAILWLVLSGAGKMKIILRSDWPLERTRRAHHACFSQNRFCFAHIINPLMTNLSFFAQDDVMCPRSFLFFFFSALLQSFRF